MEVLLIDNRSSDCTRGKIEDFCIQHNESLIKRFWNTTNRGYACGVNQGLSVSRGDFVLLLGPDTRVFPGSLETMIDFLKTHPDVGLVAPQLLDLKGRIMASCRRFPNHGDVLLELSGLPRIFPARYTPRWKMPDFEHKTQMEVEQPEATCLMTHRNTLNEVGFMDERFPMFFNDVDWCRRFKMKGRKIVFYPDSKVQHQRGASILPHRIPMIWKSHQGFYRYFQKYAVSLRHKVTNQGLGLLLILAATFRTILVLLGHIKIQGESPKSTHHHNFTFQSVILIFTFRNLI